MGETWAGCWDQWSLGVFSRQCSTQNILSITSMALCLVTETGHLPSSFH